MQLSIIIPVYNVEPYVARCIESLMQQDLPHDEYEVIVINDGSPDNSRNIILKLQEKYDNIKCIDQENMGVSVARNNGIATAAGEYLLCVDPDDYLSDNTLATVLEMAKSNALDVLYLGYTIFGATDSLEYESNYHEISGVVMSGPELYFKSRGQGVRDPDRSVGILYRTDFLKENKLVYPVDVPYLEDGLFLAKVLCLAERCSFNAAPFYQRTTRMGSATHSNLIYSEKARNGFIKAAVEIRTFGQENNLNKNQDSLINQAIAKFVLLPLQSSSLVKERRIFDDVVDSLTELNFRHLELNNVMPIYHRLGWVYNLSNTLFYYYYRYLSLCKKLRLLFISNKSG